MQYEVRALDEGSQQLVLLDLHALDLDDAQRQTRARGLTPLKIRPQTLMLGGRRRDRFSVDLFAQELHALVHAGLSLVESLEAFAEKEQDPVSQAVLARLLQSLRDGKRFSQALGEQGERFPALFIGLVEAAENTGELAPALERYIVYAQRLQAVRQRLVSAAIYPAILLSVGALVALFLMGWVVPRFAAVYRGSGRELPWGSRLLLDWGEWAGAHAAGLWLGALGLALATAWALQRLWRDGGAAAVMSRVPGAARWFEQMTLSRLFLTLGLLLRGGLPIQQALTLARSVLPAPRVAAIDQVAQRIAEGQTLSLALEEAGLSTAISSRFVRAGERSGQVAEMLHKAALYHDAETSRWAERFSKVFEPLLMAAIGLVIGVIVLLLYMPIFDLAGSLQ